MPSHLVVKIGSDRHSEKEAIINQSSRPFEIDTEHFVGRVLIRVRDAPGAREGEPGMEYFRDRSRKFCIQIEGRFKRPWKGSEILFGTDFDHLVDIPRTPFNTGMRIARFIDPCTFYEEHPPSGRPYIMSPYAACMNTICAWPAPSRAHDAVVVLRHVNRINSPAITRSTTPILNGNKTAGSSLTSSPHNSDDEGDVVPVESLQRSDSAKTEETSKKKKRASWFGGFGGQPKENERKPKKYWRFVGFKDEPAVRAILEAHHATPRIERSSSIARSASTSSRRQGSTGSETSTADRKLSASDVQHGPTPPTLSRLGTSNLGETLAPPDRSHTPNHDFDSRSLSPSLGSPSTFTSSLPVVSSSNHPHIARSPSPLAKEHSAAPPLSTGLGTQTSNPQTSSNSSNSGSNPILVAPKAQVPQFPPLERISTSVRKEAEQAALSDGLEERDFKVAEELMGHLHVNHDGKGWESKLDDQLGPYRFSDPKTDMMEDNAFIFKLDSVPVPKRRKHFADEKNREEFTYDPDIVYGTSFFTDAADLNTLSLSLGPVKMGLQRFFTDMPIRYSLRATGPEELTFCTVSFQLVEDK